MKKIVISLIFTLSAVYGNANQLNPQSDQQQENFPNNFIQSLNKNVWPAIKNHPKKTTLGSIAIVYGILQLKRTLRHGYMLDKFITTLDNNRKNTDASNSIKKTIIGTSIAYLGAYLMHDVLCSKETNEKQPVEPTENK